MHFAALPGIVCIVAAAVTQMGTKPNPPTVSSDYSVTAGQSSTFTWKPTTQGPVTLTLRSGVASDLNKGLMIAQSVQNMGSYIFTLPSNTTRNSDDTIEISVHGSNDPDSTNYSAPFVVESKNTVTSITPSASPSATTSMTMASSATSAPSAASPASSATSASSTSSSADFMSTSARSASSMGSTQSATSSTSNTAGSSSMTASSSAASTSGSSPSSTSAASTST